MFSFSSLFTFLQIILCSNFEVVRVKPLFLNPHRKHTGAHACTHTHTLCSHLSVETACQFSACLGKPSITKALLPFSALFHILSCSFLFFPSFLHVCNSVCLFSLLEGRNCLCHALSSMARIKALECIKANLLCCS